MNHLIDLITIIISCLLLFTPVSVLIAAFKKRNKFAPTDSTVSFGIIVTCYKNAKLAVPLINSLMKQNYPKEKYTVYVVADNCHDYAFPEFTGNIKIILPTKILASKVRSISYALDRFQAEHDFTLILDADNLVPADFLGNMNAAISAGYIAVQGRRTAKNTDTEYARLDAAGEIYYNYTQRNVPFTLGSSAAIAGSGMAVKTGLMRSYIGECVKYDKLIIAEDKALQLFLIDNDVQIAYTEDAVLYDEKVSEAEDVQRQRTRWLKSYFDYLLIAAKKFITGKMTFNRAYFLLMVMCPPIVVLGFITLIGLFVSLVFGNITGIYLLLISGLSFTVNFIVALKSNMGAKLLSALLNIPRFAYRQLLAMMQLKKASKDFMQTNNTRIIEIEQIK